VNGAFLIDLANIAAINAILALSLNLMIGYAGLFSVTQGALYGIGAYAFALLELRLGWPFWLAIAGAAVVPALAGIVVALPSLRLSGDYLIIASLGLQTVIVALMTNLDSLTGGSLGLVGIPPPKIGGWQGIDAEHYLPFSLILCALATLALVAMVRGPYGRALRMIGADELAAASIGKNVMMLKVSAFVIGSAMAGVAGAAQAGYVTYIDPSSFTILTSIYVLTLVIVGGSGSVLGSLVGTVAIVAMEESLRFVDLPANTVGQVRQAGYGALLILFVLLRPQGLLGGSSRRRARAALAAEKAASAIQSSTGQTMTVTAPLNGKNDGKNDLECRDLVVSYGPQTALRGVTITARPGEIVMIAGHNGSGKSTLLKAIAGHLPIRGGTVMIRGEDYTNRQAKLVGPQRIGMVPQTGGVFPALSVADNLKLAGYGLRRDGELLAERIGHVLELFPRLGEMADRPAGQLSGGQQRMLSLAMALVPEHRLLLLDEPSIGLSPVMVESTLETIQHITRQLGITALLCEQNVRPALAIADRAYVLRAGQVALEAPAAQLLGDDDLWRLF
jgi:branched-chain amino acid transport system permease protein